MRTVFFFFILVLWLPSQAQKETVISSPDKKISFHLTTQNNALAYSIRFGQAEVIQSSPLGLTVNGIALGGDAKLGSTAPYKMDESFAWRGVHSMATNKCNGARIIVTSNNYPFVIEARVFNDGAAFRYVIDAKDSSLIDKEATAFTLPPDCFLWSQSNIKYYEGPYTKKRLDTIKQGLIMGPPVTVLLPGGKGYAAITEGGLTDFAGLSLIAKGERVLAANLTGVTRKNDRIETPWRIVEIGADLNTLVNCDIIAAVSPGYDKKLFPKGFATDWVKPGRGVWTWLAGRGPVTLENLKHFTDLAAQLGFEYNLVDEGWGRWKDSAKGRDNWDMMKELVDYSTPKGVKIWVWKAYPNRGGIPGIKDPAKRKEFFRHCKQLGIVGLKIDFFDSEGQEIIDFYQAALKDAAAYGLMIDFHGANKPTGESRTYPNEMTREGIRGLENRPPWNPHNAVIPFTRYLAGHGDYTPLHFGDRLGETTWSYQVATAVVFTSPFLCFGADPQSILDNPAKELIKSIPSTWDETIVLPQSSIGETVLFARRKGGTWFVAAMNGTKEAKTLNVDLSFLKSGKYSLYEMKDNGAKQAAADIKEGTVTSKDVLSIILNSTGGYVGRLTTGKM